MTSEFAIAVHAIVFLNHMQKPVSSKVLGESVCTNPARIRKIMTKLKQAELIETKEGIGGGYLYHGNPDSLSLEQICKALQVSVVSSAWKTGNQNMDCLIGSGMADIMDGIYQELDDVCMEKLSHITITMIDEKIFSNRNGGRNG